MEHYENEFLHFISVTLDFIEFISLFSEVSFIDDLTNEKVFLDPKKEVGRFFLKQVYDHIENGKILFYADGTLQKFEFEPFHFKIETPRSSICELLEKFSILYEDFIDVSEKKYVLYSNLKNRFIHSRNKITSFASLFDISSQDILEYLDSYYQLLFYFFYHDKMQQNEIIHSLLFLDTFYDEKNQFTYSFWSPLLLEQLRIIEIELNQYHPILSSLDKNYFLHKIQERFCWNLLNDQDKLSVASLGSGQNLRLYPIEHQSMRTTKKGAYMDKKGVFPSFSDPSTLDYFYFDHCKKEYKQKDCIYVAIAGEITSYMIEKLYDHLLQSNLEKGIEKTLVFEVYTNQPLSFSEKYHSVIHTVVKEQVLKKKSILHSIISSCDFFLVFDSPDLYSNQSLECKAENMDFLIQKFAFANILEDSPGYLEGLILLLSSFYDKRNCYYPIQEICNDTFHVLFELSKEQNTSVFLFLHTAIDEVIGRKKEDFDMNIHYIEGKEESISECFYSRNSPSSQNFSGQQAFSFSLFEFYRFLFFDDSFFHEFVNENKQFLNVKVSLDYSNLQFLQFYYSCPENVSRDLAYQFLETKFIPYFHSTQEMHDFICSFFYNISSNCNDLIFTHLFSKKNSSAFKENNQYITRISHKEVLFSDDRIYFPYKWLYAEVIKKYDISANVDLYIESARLKSLLFDLEKSGQLKERTFYQHILASCKRFDYSNSYLGQKCATLIKKYNK